jgi:hypothetical protein
MIKMKQNDPTKMENFHRDPRRRGKPFGTNNPKYSFYHLVDRKPLKFSFLGCEMHFRNRKRTQLSIFWRAITHI